MERRSVVEYLDSFLRRGRECAYVQRRGYRAERWSYRQVAEAAFRFARELEKRGIGKGERVLLGYRDPRELADQYDVIALMPILDRMASLLAELVAEAAS